MEVLHDPRYRGSGLGGKGRVNVGPLADSRLDAPLPWDIIDVRLLQLFGVFKISI